MPEKTRYIFARSEQSIFSEIYFPKHAAYQGTIFDALKDGYSEKEVKRYLTRRVKNYRLLDEFKDYPALFDPDDYTKIRRVKTPVSVAEAEKRIEMYRSPFKGWSVYSVDGVFFDVLRCILFSSIARQGRLYEHKLWGKAEEAQFMRNHTPWPARKRAFAQQHFADIAREVNQWIDDRALFIFAYLVKQFAEKVLVEQLYEQEIWVANLFDQNLNVVRRIESGATPT